ncbi:MAG: hypothetical protein EA388_13235 [Nitriliruptor sp.]|nr:MAG: hypothetical protein EA388_13235 [Nitriliruptor sp.]
MSACPVHDHRDIIATGIRLGDEPPAGDRCLGDVVGGHLREDRVTGLVVIGEFRQRQQLRALRAGQHDRRGEWSTARSQDVARRFLADEPELVELHIALAGRSGRWSVGSVVGRAVRRRSSRRGTRN